MLESLNIKHSKPAVNKQDMTSQKFLHTFPMMGNTCTYKLCKAATVYFPWASNLLMLVTTKACSNYKGLGECEQTISTKVSLLVAESWQTAEETW